MYRRFLNPGPYTTKESCLAKLRVYLMIKQFKSQKLPAATVIICVVTLRLDKAKKGNQPKTLNDTNAVLSCCNNFD